MIGERFVINEAMPWTGPTGRGVHRLRLLVEVVSETETHAFWRLVEVLSESGGPPDTRSLETGGFAKEFLPELIEARLYERTETA